MRSVRWLGGAGGGGKSTVARALAARTGGAVYVTDDTLVAHALPPGPDAPLLGAFAAMSMDERWVDRDPTTMLRTFGWFAGERFERVVADVADVVDVEATRGGPVVVEGFRLLPRLVEPLLDDVHEAVWLEASPRLRRAVYAARPPEQQFWRRTRDPARALDNLLARDALFAAEVRAEAAALGLRVVPVDGSRAVDDVVAEVDGWFRRVP